MQVTQSKVVSGAATSQVGNAGVAERWGGEVEITAAPAEDLIVSLSFACADGDFEEFGPVCGSNTPIVCLDAPGSAKQSSPQKQLDVSTDYLFGRTGVGGIYGDVQLNYEDEYPQLNYQDEYPENPLWSGVVNGDPVIYDHQGMDARSLVDARLSLDNIPIGDSQLRATLWGKNLLDDDYPTYSINFGGLGLVTEQYGAPRTYGLEVHYDY